MDNLRRSLLLAGLTATSVLAQCSAPEFFGSSEILAIGQRAFSVVNGGNGGCSDGGQSGNVYLIRPGDSSFQAIQMGTFDATNGTSASNTIVAPSVPHPGYGYKIIIGPDASSTPVASSPTFALVTNDWYSQSFDAVAVVYPSPQSDTTSWSSNGEQLLAYQAFQNLDISSFTVLLYNADDATQAPTIVTTGVPIPSIDQTTDLYYFTIQNTLPTGSNYQLVLVPSADQTDKILSMSGLIQIQDGSGGPNSFPYTYTQVRTIGAAAVSTSATSTGGNSTTGSSVTASTVSSSSTSGSSSSSSTTSSTSSSAPSSTTLTSGGTTLVVPATAPAGANPPGSNPSQPTTLNGGGTLPQGSSAPTSGALRAFSHSWQSVALAAVFLIALLQFA